jgi:hypothetical protein
VLLFEGHPFGSPYMPSNEREPASLLLQGAIPHVSKARQDGCNSYVVPFSVLTGHQEAT